MMVRINDKEHIIVILRHLLDVDDLDVMKYSLESLIEALEEDSDQEDNEGNL